MCEALRRHVRDAEAVAAAWRRHQLEISWLVTAMARYEDFEAVSRYALDAALGEAGAELGAEERRGVLTALERLELHDDVRGALEGLDGQGLPLAVLSNGSPRLLEVLLAHTGVRARFDEVISADEVRAYKPAPAVYRHAAERLGRPVEEVWLVSANPFDVAGAKAAGLRAALVERRRTFRYGFAPPPDAVVATLVDLPSALALS